MTHPHQHGRANVTGLVLYGAFTGKAAYVLRQKGCEGATTIHSLIYISRDKELGFSLKLTEADERALDEIRLRHALTAERVRSCPKVFGTPPQQEKPDGDKA
jgi:hypothetical protein